MNTQTQPGPTVLYVMDAYCGWCWGFSKRVSDFEVANRHRVAFAVISGGLFIGPRAAPLSHYPFIAEANDRIAAMTGAVFGDDYQAVLRQGDLVMDSLDAAAALAALRAQAPDRALHWADALQAAFYERGESLSSVDTVAAIARAGGLDEAQVLRCLDDGTARSWALADFERAQRLGVSSYPTLLFVRGDAVHRLPGTGATLEALNRALDSLLGDR